MLAGTQRPMLGMTIRDVFQQAACVNIVLWIFRKLLKKALLACQKVLVLKQYIVQGMWHLNDFFSYQIIKHILQTKSKK